VTENNRQFGMVAAALAALVVLGVLVGRTTSTDAAMLLARAAHVFAAMVWVGLIWFVNMIQLRALAAADPAERVAITTHIVPQVAAQFRLAANITLLSGIGLVALSAVTGARPLGSLWLWIGIAGGTAMVGLVHAKISPTLRTVLDPAITDEAVKNDARGRLRFYARCNLLLALPVTLAMLAAAHG
jgi:uncharacterized membrane protein